MREHKAKLAKLEADMDEKACLSTRMNQVELPEKDDLTQVAGRCAA